MKEPARRLIANHYLIKITMIDGLIAFRAFAMSKHTVSPVKRAARASSFPVPLSICVSLDTQHWISLPALLAPELDIANEHIAGNAGA
jgi:hypothetical protein